MTDIVRATGQWMNHKTIVEYADNPVVLMDTLAERHDPEHNLAEEDVFDQSHKNCLASSYNFRGLNKGTADEIYKQLWGMFQAGTDKTQLVANVHASANNFHNTMGALTVGYIDEPAPTGSRLDPNKAVQGDPNCFIRSKPIDVGFPVVKIAIDCGVLSDVRTETVANRGAIIAEAIVRAELSGYKTRITAFTATDMRSDNLIAIMALNLKREDEPMNYSRVLYPILEASFLRGVSFSWRATLPELKHSHEIGMGASLYATFKAAQRAELYADVFGDDTLVFNIGAMCAEMSEDEARKHVEDQLQSREASLLDGSLRGQINYTRAADIKGQIDILNAVFGGGAGDDDDDDWDDEDDDPDYKIIG